MKSDIKNILNYMQKLQIIMLNYMKLQILAVFDNKNENPWFLKTKI